MDKIVYKCKNCTWKASVPALWSDLRPGVCGNKKCKTNFKKNPEELMSELVEAVPTTKPAVEMKQPEIKKQMISQQPQQPQKQTQPQSAKKEESEKE